MPIEHLYEGNGQWSEVYVPESPQRPVRPPANAIDNYTPPKLDQTDNRDTTETLNKADKDFIEIEENILEGEAQVIPDPNRRAKTTILMQYLGKSLTGLYFVDKVKHTFNSSTGYSQDITVSRNGFGSSLKKGDGRVPVGQVAPTQGGLIVGTGDNSRPPTPTRPTPPPPVQPKVAQRTHTVVRGDCLYNIAKKYYGRGNTWNKIYQANRDKIKNPNLIYPGQVFVIP